MYIYLQTVEVSLAIDGSVILEGDLDVKGDIDEISTDNIVTLAGNHTIAEPKTFSQYANFSGTMALVLIGFNDVECSS